MISILIPTLGEREFEITRLLDSLVSQTYKNFEVVFVNQGAKELLDSIIRSEKYQKLAIKHIQMNQKGISKARNLGLQNIEYGNIVTLSDDDAWYPKNGLEKISEAFEQYTTILISQIYDPLSEQFYKDYPSNINFDTKNILGRSSIEISFKWDDNLSSFDEKFGLGSTFPSAEEVDFLLSNRESSKFKYINEITVYHEKKKKMTTPGSIFAKGALYAKHFNIFISFFVLLRDFFVKKENNFKEFLNGYKKYKQEL